MRNKEDIENLLKATKESLEFMEKTQVAKLLQIELNKERIFTLEWILGEPVQVKGEMQTSEERNRKINK